MVPSTSAERPALTVTPRHSSEGCAASVCVPCDAMPPPSLEPCLPTAAQARRVCVTTPHMCGRTHVWDR